MDLSLLRRRLENSVECFIAKYKSLPLFEKILDALLISAVFLTALFLALEYFFNVPEHVIHVLHRADIVLSVVFIADLVRTFNKSEHWVHFMRHHWLDVVAVLIVLVAFSAILYPAAGRVSYLFRAQNLHKVTKFYHLRHAAKLLV